MTLSLLQQYGITHWDAYHPDINMKVLARKVEKTVDNNRNASHIKLFKNMKDMMDEAMRPLPQYVFLLGAEYTPQEFARSVCRPDEYVALTVLLIILMGKPSPWKCPTTIIKTGS